MSALDSLAAWLEATRVAEVVGTSMWLLAALSAVHVLGYTLVMGGALVANLRLMGLLLPGLPVGVVTRPANRGISLGLSISITTGVLLVSWKATAAFASDIFQVKMLLLLAAAVLRFTWQRSITRSEPANTSLPKAAGVIGLALWLGLAVAGCAYILLE